MKFLTFLLLSVCSIQGMAAWETVVGNGKLIKQNRDAANYYGIDVRGSLNVQLDYGSSKTIVVEADENLLPYIETSVENGVLVIKQKKGVSLKSKHNLIIYANLTKLTALTLSGSGNVSGKGAFANDGKTQIRLSGSGNIGLGVAEINELDISVSGSGNIKITGNKNNNIVASISGSGNIDCTALQTNNVAARVSGSGNVKVFAVNSIQATVSGSGNIYYKGSADKLNLKSSGSGKLIKI